MSRKTSFAKVGRQEAPVDFTELMKRIPNGVFIRMVMKAGLTPQDSRALCMAHKEL